MASEEEVDASATVDAMIRGVLDVEDHRNPEVQTASDLPSSPMFLERSEGPEDEQALGWHEVIELQAFSERKAWIEEKIRFLEKLPSIDVFAGLDALRRSADELPGLPMRAELEAWLIEHDKIEKETEIFDSGELKKLKKFTKAATQRNLSPQDTDLIELTLTTIYELDKLLHLLRDRSDNLDLLGIRLTWEERRTAAWSELHSVLYDIKDFLASRARWSPTVYDTLPAEEENTLAPDPERKRRNSVVSITSMSSESSNPGFSRSTRYRVAEFLSRDAAQFASRVSSLKHTKIGGAGKTLDKLIDHSRKPVPDEILDEQDRLENHGIYEMDDVGKFVMGVVMQWKKADEIYVETVKDRLAAQTLLEELEVAQLSHPTSRQDAAFLSRVNTLTKRLAMRDNPAASSSLFPLPVHPLFPDQTDSNAAIVRLLSSEIESTVEQVKKAERCAKDHHATFEMVKRMEDACKAASGISSRLEALMTRFEEGILSDDGDGTPPEVNKETCLEATRHSAFLAAMPAMTQELEKTSAEASDLLSSTRVGLLQLDRHGIDLQFKTLCDSAVERLAQSQHKATKNWRDVSLRASMLRTVRHMWSVLGQVYKEVVTIRGEVTDAMTRNMWHQQVQSQQAPPTPDSPVTTLPPLTTSPLSVRSRLNDLQAHFTQEVSSQLSRTSTSIGRDLHEYLSQCCDSLIALLDRTGQWTNLWEQIRNQTTAMEHVRDEVHNIQVQIEDLKIRFDDATHGVLSGSLSGDGLLLTEGGLSSELKRSQDLVHSFVEELPRRVTFVGQPHVLHHPNDEAYRRQLTLSTDVSLPDMQGALSSLLPVNLAALNQAVRSDSNAYSMMISGAIKVVEQKSEHFQLAKAAVAFDTAMASVLKTAHDLNDTLISIQRAIDDIQETSVSEDLEALSADADRMIQVDGQNLARSFSPVRLLLHHVRSISGSCEASVADGITTSRQRSLEDAENQYTSWIESAKTLQQRISLAREAEQARFMEEARIEKELEQARQEAAERERLEAEEQVRLEAEERERLEAAERARLEIEEQTRLEAEEQARLEQEHIERERSEAESRRQREEREGGSSPEADGAIGSVPLDRQRNVILSPDILEPVQESESEVLITQDTRGPRPDDDIFGLYVPPKTPRTESSRQYSALHSQILALRKRLLSIRINDVARSTAHSEVALPSDDRRRRMDSELTAVIADVNTLPEPAADDLLIDAELRSLKMEVDASLELMRRVHQLADLALAIRVCDDALSDLLEHIDSYPAPPLGTLSSSHTSDSTLAPEKQLSARLTFTKDLIHQMASKYSTLSDDPRAIAEHDRVMQTWSELESMAADRLNGTKSRPSSAMSSGRNSRASANSGKAAIKKKASGYSNLSVGDSKGRFLTPPLNTRRTASGSSASQHSRSSSRVSATSSNRSVSGPGQRSTPLSSLHGSTFSSRQRTTSVSSTTSVKTPLKQAHLAVPRARSQTGHTPRTASPAFSDASALSVSRPVLSTSHSSTSRSSWARTPRQSFPTVIRSPPRKAPANATKRPYIANPKNKLDVAVGDVVNRLPVNINVEVVADTWKDQSGKYWIGDQDPKLCFCRILRSQTVMVRVGGGWAELSRFIRDHFADAFRILPESPRLGSREEKWISSTTLSQAAESIVMQDPPKTPEPRDRHMPSFSLSTPSGTSPKSIKTASSPGSPLTPLQFLRRVERESPVPRPETPTRSSRSGTLKSSARPPIWRP